MPYIHTYTPHESVPGNVILPEQVHGTHCVEIITGKEDVTACDALYTNKNFALGVRTADCVPLCAWDEDRYGIAHIGWRGFTDGFIESFLTLFTHPSVFIGPFLHHFIIQPDECMQRISDYCGTSFFTSKENGVEFDFYSAIVSHVPKDTQIDQRDTYATAELVSWRRDHTSARNVTVISR